MTERPSAPNPTYDIPEKKQVMPMSPELASQLRIPSTDPRVKAYVQLAADQIGAPGVALRVSKPETYTMRHPAWVCYHCGDAFADQAEAALHFGETPERTPACHLMTEGEEGLLKALREAEGKQNRNTEDYLRAVNVRLFNQAWDKAVEWSPETKFVPGDMTRFDLETTDARGREVSVYTRFGTAILSLGESGIVELWATSMMISLGLTPWGEVTARDIETITGLNGNQNLGVRIEAIASVIATYPIKEG